jgi:hypothetical protein
MPSAYWWSPLTVAYRSCAAPLDAFSLPELAVWQEVAESVVAAAVAASRLAVECAAADDPKVAESADVVVVARSAAAGAAQAGYSAAPLAPADSQEVEPEQGGRCAPVAACLDDSAPPAELLLDDSAAPDDLEWSGSHQADCLVAPEEFPDDYCRADYRLADFPASAAPDDLDWSGSRQVDCLVAPKKFPDDCCRADYRLADYSVASLVADFPASVVPNDSAEPVGYSQAAAYSQVAWSALPKPVRLREEFPGDSPAGSRVDFPLAYSPDGSSADYSADYSVGCPVGCRVGSLRVVRAAAFPVALPSRLQVCPEALA